MIIYDSLNNSPVKKSLLPVGKYIKTVSVK